MTAPPPLTGLTVLDFSRVIAGPFLTQMLGDLGADIVKVEAPGVGDDMRHYRPKGWTKDAPGFVGLNRNKRSIEIDMSTPAGQDVCRQLAAKADFLVENFRPDVMRRYGLHYEAMREVNPRLIYCSISGYGQEGPYRLVAGYDPIAQAESGMMYLTGPIEVEPQKAGGSIGDSFTGLHAGMALLAALHSRNQSGLGQHVEASLFDSMMSALGYVGQHTLLLGEDPPRMGNKSFALTPLGVFQASDGPIMIVVGNDRQYKKFCEDVLERPDLMDATLYGSIKDRMANRETLEREIQTVFLTADREHWVQRMRTAGVPGGAVRSPMEAVRSPEAEARGLVRKAMHDGEEIEVVGPAFRLSETPPRAPAFIPARGEHTDAVLQDVLDLGPSEIEALRGAGAFGKVK